MVHVEEETLGTRLIVNTLTCLLAKEADPTRLVASSPGKLVRHLVTSGTHVEQSQAYAEVEVMKMVMPLLAPVAGVISFVLPEGTTLSGGDLIARLALDDPNAVVLSEVFTGGFPSGMGPPVVSSNQLDQRFREAFEECKMVMSGEMPHPKCIQCLLYQSVNSAPFCLCLLYIIPSSQDSLTGSMRLSLSFFRPLTVRS